MKEGPTWNSFTNMRTPPTFKPPVKDVYGELPPKTPYDLLFMVNGVRSVSKSAAVMKIVCQMPESAPASITAALASSLDMFSIMITVAPDINNPVISTSISTTIP